MSHRLAPVTGSRYSPMAVESPTRAETDAPQLLTIVLPVHNEREVLGLTYERLRRFGLELGQLDLDHELLFVNDGSTDGSSEILDQLAADDDRVGVIHLTRNFGHQAAVCAGLAAARGDAVVIMDADLQDPPEVLPTLIAPWRDGHQVVHAVRTKRKEGFAKRFAYWAFYRIYRRISDLDVPPDSGDFCLLDRSAVDLLNALPERQRFVRGLRSWVGLKQTGVTYERAAREAGTPSYDFRGLVRLAIEGLVSFSATPLRLASRLGLIAIIASFVVGFWILLAAVVFDRTPAGWASLASLLLLLSSVQLFSLGVIGEYLARIFLETKGRPTYLVARTEGAPASTCPVAPERHRH
ncbi:MAG: glycosyltransferase family 2 protein [Acidimicrobiales bacterium]